MEATAVRTWNRPRTKAVVTVTLPDGTVEVLGGKRAERAEAAVVLQVVDYYGPDGTWVDEGIPTDGWYVLGLRADYGKAEVEAEKWRKDRPERYRSRFGGIHTLDRIIKGREAYAVEVVEG